MCDFNKGVVYIRTGETAFSLFLHDVARAKYCSRENEVYSFPVDISFCLEATINDMVVAIKTLGYRSFRSTIRHYKTEGKVTLNADFVNSLETFM